MYSGRVDCRAWLSSRLTAVLTTAVLQTARSTRAAEKLSLAYGVCQFVNCTGPKCLGFGHVDFGIWYRFVNCSRVVTRWQYYCTHLHTYST